MSRSATKSVNGQGGSLRRGFFCIFLALVLLVLNSCASILSPPRESRPPASVEISQFPPQQNSSPGIVEEIRSLTETGAPSSLLGALEIIRSRNLGATEFGRMMTAVNVTLLRTIYPAIQAQTPPQDPPVTHSYSRILREAERGAYTVPHHNSNDYLEHVLPFLAYYPRAGGRTFPPERYLSVLPDLQKAEILNPNSVLAGYFTGIVYEQAGRLEDAFIKYSQVWEAHQDCYPAALGLVRVMEAMGRRQETVQFLQQLVIFFPDNLQVKRRMAFAYYNAGEWSRAETAVAEILQRDNRDAEFILMSAHILVEQGQFIQAQAPLDIYAAINPNNSLYLFLRARVQAEGYNNRDSALNYLRSLIRSSQAPDTADEAFLYALRLLMESPRPEDQAEGRELLKTLLAVPDPLPEVISLALDDAIRREAWDEGRPYMTRLLEERRSYRDLLSAYTVEKEQGNNAAALSYARELYERDRYNEEGIIAYVTALIDTGRNREAAEIIDSRLNGIAGGPVKSRYYFLRSRLRTSEELMMNDLRSSLFEDPRNLDSIISLFEIYRRRGDERRAVYYLRQALALAPNDARLRGCEEEYASALGNPF